MATITGTPDGTLGFLGLPSLERRFAGVIAAVSRLTSLCQQPADVSQQFQLTEELILELPLSDAENSAAARRLSTARQLQNYREFGAARHELCLLRRCLIRSQRQIESEK